MLVGMPARRSMGAYDVGGDALLFHDDDGLTSAVKFSSKGTDDLMVPSFATSSSSAPPVNATQGNNASSWDWSKIGQTFTAGIVQGLFKPSAPTMIKPPASTSSGISTGAIVAGIGAAALVTILLLRRRSA